MSFYTLYRNIPNFPSIELETSNETKLLTRLVEEYGFSKPIINMSNHWYDYTLHNQIQKRIFYNADETAYVGFTDIRIEKPTFEVTQNNKTEKIPLLPYTAVERGITYFGNIYAYMYTYNLQTNTYVVSKTPTLLGYIPIMVGSNKCYLWGLSDEDKVKLGESPNDPLGYFIIKGTKKIINIQENLRSCIHFTFSEVKQNKTSKQKMVKSTITCPSMTGYSLVEVFPDKTTQGLEVKISGLKKDKFLNLFAAFFIVENEVNILNHVQILYENQRIDEFNDIMEKEYDKYSKFILLYCQPNEYTQILSSLHMTVSNIRRIFRNKSPLLYYDDICYYDKKKNENPFLTMKNVVCKNLFSHIVPNITKCHHLAFMSANLLRNLLGYRQLDNRDSWANKRLETAARSMEKLFNAILGEIFQKFSEKIKAMTQPIIDLDNLKSDIPISEIGDQFETAFGPGAWGLRNMRSKDNITDNLKAETPLAIYSQIGRINTPAGRKGKQTEIRMLQPSQYGYICPMETPEGENIGLVKNLAITTFISMEKNSDILVNLLYTPELSSVYSLEYKEGWIPFLVNGQFIGYGIPGNTKNYKDVMGKELSELIYILRKKRRSLELPYDCCIHYNYLDNIIEYYSDSSRPCRPLLIVDTDGELVIDKYNMWNYPINDLFKYGAIELLDVREHEYIMCAEYTDDIRNRNLKIKTLKNILENYSSKLEPYLNEMYDKYEYYFDNIVDFIADLYDELVVKYSGSLGNKLPDEENILKVLNQVGQLIKLFVMETVKFYITTVITDKFSADDLYKASIEHSSLTVKELIKDIISSENMTDLTINKGNYDIFIQNIKSRLNISVIFANDMSNHANSRQIISTLANELKHEYIREYEYMMERVPYTHSEINPVAIFGISGSLEPKPNHGQGPRASYQASMYKQALGYYHYNRDILFDTSFKALLHPTRPIFESAIAEVAGLNTAPTGTTMISAYHILSSNNEDAYPINRDFVDTFSMDYVKYITFKVEAISSNSIEEFKRPDIKSGELNNRYAAINENGLPKLDHYIRPGDCVIGKIRREKINNKPVIINVSEYAGVGQEGYVDRVLVTYKNKTRIVKVRLRHTRKHITGDKLAYRYAQKGTGSKIYDANELPRIIGGINDGVVPDIFVNPLNIASRMTIGLLFEMLASKAALYKSLRVNATSFNSSDSIFDAQKYQKILKDMGMDENGEEYMAWPDGTIEKVKIFIAPCYIQQLRHHVLDKIQHRGQGSVKPLTHQPNGGRSVEGGQRFGEQERDALISHAAAGIIQERMMYVSDVYRAIYCKTCGNIAISDVENNKNICKLCGPKASFGMVEHPYVLKLIQHHLLGMNISLTYKFREK